MDLKDFWDMVEKHPYIPRIIVGDYHRLCSAIEADPQIIAELYSPTAIGTRVSHIRHEDWSRLDQNAGANADSYGKDSESAKAVVSQCNFQACYWHNPDRGDLPFIKENTNCEVFFDSSMSANQKRVCDLIAEIKSQGGVLDAVVEVIGNTAWFKQKPANDSRQARALAGLGESRERFGYTIYIPPKIPRFA